MRGSAPMHRWRQLLPAVRPRAARLMSSDPALTLHQERIALSLFANGGERTMSGDDKRIIWQRQNSFVQGIDNFFHRSARQIGAANASRKQRVAGYQLALCWKIEADAALCVCGSMNDVGCQ